MNLKDCIDHTIDIILLSILGVINPDWKGSPFNSVNGLSVKKDRKFFNIHSGTHDHQLEILSSFQQTFQQTNQNIRVDGSLVGLIENDDIIVIQPVVHHKFSQQHAIGDKFDLSLNQRYITYVLEDNFSSKRMA